MILAVGKIGSIRCSRCNETIQGPAYLCERDKCGFILDESCFGLSKNQELLHPLHPHPLLLSDKPPTPIEGYVSPPSNYVCDGCNSTCGRFFFHCENCDFKLDVRCALSNETQPEAAGDDQQKKPTTIKHFADHHSLKLFNCRWEDRYCPICEEWIIGPAYGCFECGTYLHISCAEFPPEIKHPYHPQHPLRACATNDDERLSAECKVCREFVGGAGYLCRPCGFALDMPCALETLLSVPLKHQCHEHNLYCIAGSEYKEGMENNDQEEEDSDTESSYYGTEDEEEDIENDEDDQEDEESDEEEDGDEETGDGEEGEEEDPNEGTDVGEDVNAEAGSDVGDDETDTSFNSDLPVSDHHGMKDFKNDHALTFYERSTTSFLDETCFGCQRWIKRGSYYICQSCEKFFHKLCAELPAMIRHPLHSQHPLSFFVPADDSEVILCDGCGKFSYDGGYKCHGCQFMLDIKCASLTADHFQNSHYKKITISHPFHDHKLTLISHIEQKVHSCLACQVPIINTPYYTCPACQVFFHETCVDILQERNHVYHPQHLLFTKNLSGRAPCKACKLRIYGIGYHCNE
ncbi:hypothetical protein Tsubulata_025581, partial [Turnera subulata]